MSEQEIAEANEQLMAAVRAGDPDRAAALYTEDGQVLAPNQETLSGRDAIAGFFRATAEMGVRELVLETAELDLLGETIVEIGGYRLLDAGAQAVDAGKYLVVWKHTADGWRLHRDIINSNLPPDGAA